MLGFESLFRSQLPHPVRIRMGTRENGESGRLLRFFISRALCNAAGRSVRCGTVRSGYPYLLLPFCGIRRRNGRGVGCRTDRGPVWRESCYPTFAAARLMQVFRQAFLQKGCPFPLHPLLSVAYITARAFPVVHIAWQTPPGGAVWRENAFLRRAHCGSFLPALPFSRPSASFCRN